MIPGIKAGGKFTIETTIRDKDGNIKSHTIEEGETVGAEEKAEEEIKNDLNLSNNVIVDKIKINDKLSEQERKELIKEGEKYIDKRRRKIYNKII